MARQCAAMVHFQERGSVVFDYGNSLRAEARTAGFDQAFSYPGFVEAYVRPLFCQGIGPFRWAALSGDPADIAATDRAIVELFPENEGLQRWMRMAKERIAFQGLPARICWLGYGERHRAGLRINELVRSGEVTAPIVIGRDHLDSGSVASPYRETEGMRDGSDAIADWPLLNAMLNVASGAAWVASPRRGCRYRPVDPLGRAGRGRRHGRGRVPRRARADERPRDGRDAACRCGVRDRARARAGDRARSAHAPVTVLVIPSWCSGATERCAAIWRSSSLTGGSPGHGGRRCAGRRHPAVAPAADPRTRKRALARLPARAARPCRAHRPGASARRLLDLARGDVRGALALDPDGVRPPARPASARRARPGTRPSASSTTCITSLTARRTRIRTSSPTRSATRRARPASASCCC